MVISDLLLLPEGRLRAGWRLALFVVVFVAAMFVVSLLVSFTGQVWSVAVQVVIMAGATGSATWLLLRWMEGEPFVAVGLRWKRRTSTEIGQGFGVAIALAGGVTAVEWGIGAIRFESKGGGDGSSLAATLLMLSGLLALGAATEEVLFRGYAFQRLVEGSNGTVAIVVSSAVFGGLHISNPSATRLSTLNTVLAGATGSATWLLLRWMEHEPFVSVGLRWKRRAPTEIGQGFGVAIALAGGVTAVEWGIGAIRFESKGGADGSSLAVTLLMLSGLLALGATTEEVLFRGYAFQRLVEGSNGTIAILVSSAVFGGLHMSNPSATRLSTLNTVLAGALLGIAYLKTRALWWPMGFHFGWNWALAVLGHPVSGLEVAQLPWQIAATSEPVWVHGGSYGPEGGVVATVVLVIGTTATLYLLRGREMPPHDSEARAAEG